MRRFSRSCARPMDGRFAGTANAPRSKPQQYSPPSVGRKARRGLVSRRSGSSGAPAASALESGTFPTAAANVVAALDHADHCEPSFLQLAAVEYPFAYAYAYAVVCILGIVGVVFPLVGTVLGAMRDLGEQRRLALKLYRDHSESHVGGGAVVTVPSPAHHRVEAISESVVPLAGGIVAPPQSVARDTGNHHTDDLVWSERLRRSVQMVEDLRTEELDDSGKALSLTARAGKVLTDHPILCTIAVATTAPLIIHLSLRGVRTVLIRRYDALVAAEKALRVRRRQEVEMAAAAAHNSSSRWQQQPLAVKGIPLSVGAVTTTTDGSPDTSTAATGLSSTCTASKDRTPSRSWREMKRKRLAAAGVIPVEDTAAVALRRMRGEGNASSSSSPSAMREHPSVRRGEVHSAEGRSVSLKAAHTENAAAAPSLPTIKAPTATPAVRPILIVPTTVAGQRDTVRPSQALLLVDRFGANVGSDGSASRLYVPSLGLVAMVMLWWVWAAAGAVDRADDGMVLSDLAPPLTPPDRSLQPHANHNSSRRGLIAEEAVTSARRVPE